MKGIKLRRLLVFTTFLGVVGAAGIGLAHPRHQNKPGAAAPAPRPGDQDSVQITMTAGKGRLGVSVLQISSELRTHLGAPADRGVLVDAVRPDSPAAKAGLHPGDVIVEVDGDAARSATDILGAMSDRKRGDAVKLEVIRDRGHLELTATLEDDPGPAPAFGRGRLGAGGPDFEPWPRGMPDFGSFGAGDLQRQLDEARRRIDELERRLDKLAPRS